MIPSYKQGINLLVKMCVECCVYSQHVSLGLANIFRVGLPNTYRSCLYDAKIFDDYEKCNGRSQCKEAGTPDSYLIDCIFQCSAGCSTVLQAGKQQASLVDTVNNFLFAFSLHWLVFDMHHFSIQGLLGLGEII